MKNKIYYIMLCLISSFTFMNNVFAEGELSFSIDTSVNDVETVIKGSEVSIDISVISEEVINSCTFSIVSTNGIEFVEKNPLNHYSIKNDVDNIVVERVETDVAFDKNGEKLLKLKYKINSDGKLTIKTVSCRSDTDNVSGTTNDKVIEFKVKEEEDNSLKSLTVVGGSLASNFDPNVTNYIVHLQDSNFSLNMDASNSEYQDKIVITDSNGNELDASNITFKDDGGNGSMRITIKINGVDKYTLLVNYNRPELDGSLSSLKVGEQVIDLEDGKNDYTINVGKDVTEVKIEAVLKDSDNFKFVIGDSTTMFQTPSATNIYPIIIEPKDPSSGAKRVEYMITINREGVSTPVENPDSSSNNNKPSNGNQGNTTTNPSTGGISMFLMAFVLIASLIGSIYLYKKNLEGYNQL